MAEEAVAEPVQDTTTAGEETVADATTDEESTLVTEGKDSPEGETVVTDAPEAAVTIELKLPDDTLLDSDAQAAVIEFATVQKLSSEQAQAVADRENQAMLEQADSVVEHLTQLRQTWRTETEMDPEIGGDHLEETKGLAKLGLSIPGGVEFGKLLGESGYGNKKEVVKFLREVGKMRTNDNFPDGKEAAGEITMEDLFYGNTEE